MKRNLFLFFNLFLFLSGKTQISLQTGSANYAIPIFNWQDHQSNLNLNVNLSYNSGIGLKNDDVASNVGQGWNLFAGGSVHRIQVGLPDDQFEFGGVAGGIGDGTKYPAGCLYLNTTQNPANGCPDRLKRFPIFKNKNQVYKNLNSYEADRELDYFSFQFNGRTGLFILDKVTKTGVMLGDSRIKITYELQDMTTNQIRTRISSFQITDENGIIYTFSTLALSKVLQTHFYDPNNNSIDYTPSFDGGGVYHERGFVNDDDVKNPYVVDGWYLTTIKDGLTNRQIQFNYSYNQLNDLYCGSSVSLITKDNHISISDNYSYSKNPYLTSIGLPDGHTVSFIYQTESRVDLVGDHALADIDVTFNGRYVSKHKFNTSYLVLNHFSKKPLTDYAKKCSRLYLNSVIKYGVDVAGFNEPYIFDYYTGSSASGDFVPPPYSLVKDIWGYYNGSNSKDFDDQPINTAKAYPRYEGLSFSELKGLCYIRSGLTNNNPVLNPKEGYAKNGLLKIVTLPTGGSVEYEYQQNYGKLGTTQIMCGGVHVSKIKMYDSKNCTTTVPLVTNYTYEDDLANSTLWGLEQPVNKFQSSYFYEPESKYYRWRPWKSILGECGYRFMYPGIQYIEQKPNFFADKSNLLEVLSIITGTLSNISLVLDVISVIQAAASTTVIIGVIVSVLTSVFVLIKTCITDYTKNEGTDIYYNNDLNGGNSLPIQYKRVVATPGEGTNGKTIYTFTSDTEYGIWETSNTTMSQKQRYASWAYGLPLKTTVVDATGGIVKENENIYSFTNSKRTFTTSYTSCKCLVKRSRSFRKDNWEDDPLAYTTTTNSDMSVELYGMYTGRTELIQTKERDYSGGNFLETITKYGYNPANYQVNYIEKQKSNENEIEYTDITFNCDYLAAGGIFANLNTANIFNLPVKTVNSIGKKSTPTSTPIKYVLGEKVTEYELLNNGDIKPERILIKRTNTPTLFSSWVTYNPPYSYINPLPSSYKEAKHFKYNNLGKLVCVRDEGLRNITNIYDYDNRFTVATVINADCEASPSSYSSFETNSLGGWVVESGIAAYLADGITGKRCFNLNGTNKLRAASNGTKYILSFWSNTSNLNIEVYNKKLVKSAPTINGFTYYEYEIDQAEFVMISGTGKIDELRLYPKISRMRTVTYDELLGKTTECDENNRITYYEYDELGRLRFVKDDYKNTVKMYEYNQKKGDGDCPKVYYNNTITEIFYTQTCPADSYGINPYTVPANKYSSSISQLDADMQAQVEIDQYGQVTANTSGVDCLPYYYNTAITRNYAPDKCNPGTKPSPTLVPYTVPARKYRSTISQADADSKAEHDMAVNGEYNANMVAVCLFSTEPEWEANDPAQISCGTGSLAGHKLVKMMDVNPNSTSFNTEQWIDTGLDSATCPLGGGKIIDKNKKKSDVNSSQSFAVNNIRNYNEHVIVTSKQHSLTYKNKPSNEPKSLIVRKSK